MLPQASLLTSIMAESVNDGQMSQRTFDLQPDTHVMLPQIILAWLMAYAVAALCKKDGKRFTDMGPVNAAPAGTFFWV